MKTHISGKATQITTYWERRVHKTHKKEDRHDKKMSTRWFLCNQAIVLYYIIVLKWKEKYKQTTTNAHVIFYTLSSYFHILLGTTRVLSFVK